MAQTTFLLQSPVRVRAAISLAFAACSPIVFAQSEDVLVRFQPSVADQQALISSIVAEHPSVTKASSKDGVWTLQGLPRAALAGLRERGELAWVERADNHVTTPQEIAERAKRAPTLHPRLLRVTLADAASVTPDSAKSTWLPALRDAAQSPLSLARVRGGAMSVLAPRGSSSAQMNSMIDALAATPGVRSVERVRILGIKAAQPFAPNAKPNDPLYAMQWALHHKDAGINAMAAWTAAGTSPVTVAVIDSGATPHPDLDHKWVPGYDFISNRFVSVDGDLRDGDANDEGDYSEFFECTYDFQGSSWHGTHVAGIIAAQTNNGEGMSGVAPNARIQPIRALGRCGGLEEDVIDSIKWAAGVPVEGVPENRNPSKVLNLSLGGGGDCSLEMQAAVNAALARNVSIVVSAGNDNDDAKFSAPANCKGVITVAASNRDADLSSYSNFGDTVEITAPGGDYDGFEQVISTLNGGTAGQSSTFYQAYAGTSMAAPHVAGAIALMLSRDPALTPNQILNRLQSTAALVNRTVGAGLLNAGAAVAAVVDRRAVAHVTTSAGRARLIELWDKASNRFLTTADLTEVRALTTGQYGGAWVVTDHTADAYDFSATAPNLNLPAPVCRYRGLGTGATRMSADRGVCESMQASGAWLDDGFAFMASVANGGACLDGGRPVYELAADDGRYRYVWSEIERNISMSVGWMGGNVVFCLPAQ